MTVLTPVLVTPPRDDGIVIWRYVFAAASVSVDVQAPDETTAEAALQVFLATRPDLAGDM